MSGLGQAGEVAIMIIIARIAGNRAGTLTYSHRVVSQRPVPPVWTIAAKMGPILGSGPSRDRTVSFVFFLSCLVYRLITQLHKTRRKAYPSCHPSVTLTLGRCRKKTSALLTHPIWDGDESVLPGGEIELLLS